MTQDTQKFIEYLQTDTALQEKMKAAMENYAGEQTQDAVFHSIIDPIAEEAGFHITWEDYQEYLEHQAREIRELDLDEIDQVAGGLSAGGGATACIGIGIGLGGSVVDKAVRLAGGCIGLGFGYGATACAGEGVGADPELVKP